jgi:hypothetical protein
MLIGVAPYAAFLLQTYEKLLTTPQLFSRAYQITSKRRITRTNVSCRKALTETFLQHCTPSIRVSCRSLHGSLQITLFNLSGVF